MEAHGDTKRSQEDKSFQRNSKLDKEGSPIDAERACRLFPFGKGYLDLDISMKTMALDDIDWLLAQ